MRWDDKPALRTFVAGGDGDHFHVTTLVCFGINMIGWHVTADWAIQ